MQLTTAIAVLVLASSAMYSALSPVAGQSVIPGKFDVFNHKPVMSRDITENQDIKGFPFGANNRAPLHDTPTSECKCSE